MLPDVSCHVSFSPQGVCHSDALWRRAAGGSEESFRVQKRSVARSAPAAAAEDVSGASSLSCKILNTFARLLQSLVWTVSHPLTGKWKAIMQTATRGQMVVCELLIFSYFISLLFSRLDVFVTCSLIRSFDGSALGTHHPA